MWWKHELRAISKSNVKTALVDQCAWITRQWILSDAMDYTFDWGIISLLDVVRIELKSKGVI